MPAAAVLVKKALKVGHTLCNFFLVACLHTFEVVLLAKTRHNTFEIFNGKDLSGRRLPWLKIRTLTKYNAQRIPKQAF